MDYSSNNELNTIAHFKDREKKSLFQSLNHYLNRNILICGNFHSYQNEILKIYLSNPFQVIVGKEWGIIIEIYLLISQSTLMIFQRYTIEYRENP